VCVCVRACQTAKKIKITWSSLVSIPSILTKDTHYSTARTVQPRQPLTANLSHILPFIIAAGEFYAAPVKL
jgi:hypothetical protein